MRIFLPKFVFICFYVDTGQKGLRCEVRFERTALEGKRSMREVDTAKRARFSFFQSSVRKVTLVPLDKATPKEARAVVGTVSTRSGSRR